VGKLGGDSVFFFFSFFFFLEVHMCAVVSVVE
jgi:hypothetical protein